MIRAGLFLVVFLAGTVMAAPATLESVLASLHERHDFPGATVAWAGPGAQVLSLAIGMADVAQGEPMTVDSRMLAASIGKSFVAAAIVSASEEGALDLDAPLATWLGDRAWFSRLPNHAELTLRHLLNHSAGLPDHVYLPGFAALFASARDDNAPPGAEQLIALILDAEPLFQVGQGWAYSDTGYLLAALALEAALQTTWTEQVRERFLDPLALTATWPSDHRALDKLAVGMTSPENKWGLPARTVDREGKLAWHPGIEGAGGGFVSTAGDLARWGQALWSGEVLGVDGTQQLLAGVPVDPADPAMSYGLGVLVVERGRFGEVRGHRGWIPGYVSSLRYYPAYDIAVAIQVNTDVGMTGKTGIFTTIEQTITEAILATAGKRFASRRVPGELRWQFTYPGIK